MAYSPLSFCNAKKENRRFHKLIRSKNLFNIKPQKTSIAIIATTDGIVCTKKILRSAVKAP